jgi:hypothetical protein
MTEPAAIALPVSFTLNGATLIADPSGILVWPERKTAIVADLHFEKGSGFARRGVMLPPYDTGATLDRLEAGLSRLQPQRLIALGDSFHDRAAAARMSETDGARIKALTGTTEWVWITGNHDPEPPLNWGGHAVAELSDGPLTFRHEAREDAPPGEVSGHYHPKARVRVKGRYVAGRCFAVDGRRLILPAFGAYTGGLDILKPDLRRLFAKRFDVFLMAAERVWRVPSGKLVQPAAG